jgi:C1A family cysteine protease
MEPDTDPSANSHAGVSWEAGTTSMTHLTSEEMKLHLGYVPGPGELSMEERERISREAHERARLGEAEFPAQWNWRNRDGRDFISAVKSQGPCGTCVSFATAAAIDAMMRITLNLATGDPSSGLMPDLSEAQLFYCGAPASNCVTGWEVGTALNYAKEPGLVPEASYPYNPGDLQCRLSLIKHWKSLITRISGWESLELGSDPMKNWISTKGPLVTAFTVYEDFKDYTHGVYKYNGTSPRVSGHAVCVVGYDETLQAWLCKNSWGTGWGMGGYFYIGYGQCGIDAQMWGVDGLSTIYPFFKAAGAPSVCIYSGQTHYCYRDTNGNIRDIVWTGSNWAATQVTGPGGETEGPAAAGDPAVVTYQGTGFNQMHYFYSDSDGNLWDAEWTGSEWISMQVTGKGGIIGAGVPVGSKLSVVVYGGQIHCCFRDPIGFSIWDVINGSTWTLQNVTTLSGGPPAIGNLSVFVHSGTGFNQMHYCYRDNYRKIWDAIWTGSNWVAIQVTGPGGKIPDAPLAAGDPAAAIYSGQTHYCYRDADGNIWDAIQSGSNWTAVQVAGPNGSTPGAPAAAGDPAVIVWSGTGFNQMHYCYRDANGNIWDAQWTGSNWTAQNVTTVSGGPAAAGDPVVFLYSGTGFNQMHYCYRDTAGYIQDAVWNGSSWGHQII